jgi:hypothetical protein
MFFTAKTNSAVAIAEGNTVTYYVLLVKKNDKHSQKQTKEKG